MPPKRKIVKQVVTEVDQSSPEKKKKITKEPKEEPKEVESVGRTRAARKLAEDNSADNSDKPKISKTVAKPKATKTAEPKATKQAAEPKATKQPAAPKATKQPTESKATKKPAEAKATKKPAKEVEAENLVEPEGEKKPVRARGNKKMAESKPGPEEEEAKPEKIKAKPKTAAKKGVSNKEEAAGDEPEESASNGKATNPVKSTLMNKTETQWESLSLQCDKKNSEGNVYSLKLTSWNIGGIRSWLKKGGLEILKFDKPDILCLQELKCSDSDLPPETAVEGYHNYWCFSKKDGYAGVGVYSKTEPLNVSYGIEEDSHDEEGRCITLEYNDFYLINVYVPNAGRKLKTLSKRLDWNEAFKTYTKKLDEQKPVIICGDMNVAHNEIDLKNPKGNKRNAGFTQEERDGMTEFLDHGYVDSFRELYPELKDAYTFWSYMSNSRKKNIGWRLDYFILSKRIMGKVCDNVIQSDIYGSDHCPITLFVNV